MTAHVPCNAPGTECSVESHDHFTTIDHEGIEHDTPFPMRCIDCDRPAHYDESDQGYHHDDPTAECWLLPPDDERLGDEWQARRDRLIDRLNQLERPPDDPPTAEPPGPPAIEP